MEGGFGAQVGGWVPVVEGGGGGGEAEGVLERVVRGVGGRGRGRGWVGSVGGGLGMLVAVGMGI